MAEYTFFFNPMSRAQIARWALHEAGADYEPVLVDWANKPQALLAANPMGKLPTIVHHHGGHDLVSEYSAPAVEGPVQGEHERRVLVARRPELEEQVRGVLLE